MPHRQILLGLTLLGAIALGIGPVISCSPVQRHSTRINTSRLTQDHGSTVQRNYAESRDETSQMTDLDADQPQTSLTRMASSRSTSVQQSSITLDREDLQDAYTLSIRPSRDATQLIGTIKLNGKTLKALKAGKTQINLSPYLSKGRHKLEITGRYRPLDASVEISLEGPGNETTQEVGGSGIVNQIILINVQ
jgi:hypothetical protein